MKSAERFDSFLLSGGLIGSGMWAGGGLGGLVFVSVFFQKGTALKMG